MSITRKTLAILLVGIVALGVIATLTLTLRPPTTVEASTALQPAAQPTAPATKPVNRLKGEVANEIRDNFIKILAKRLGVDEAKIKANFTPAIADTIDQAFKDGEFPVEVATRLKEENQKGLTGFFEVLKFLEFLAGNGEEFHGQSEIYDQMNSAALASVGITAEEFQARIEQSIISLSDIAKERGVDTQKVKDAMLKSAKTQLDSIVKNGDLTQAQADEYYSNTIQNDAEGILTVKYNKRIKE